MSIRNQWQGDHTARVLATMAEFDLDPGSIQWTGKLVRFPGPGEPRNRRSGSGWYTAYPDHPPNVQFGCWKTGVNSSWWPTRNGLKEEFSSTQWAEIQTKQAEREREREEEAARVAEECRIRWENAAEPSPGHPYLQKKGITTFPLIRQEGDGILIVRMTSFADGNPVVCLQEINAQGEKRFVKGAKALGARCTIGGARFVQTGEGDLYVSEGYATGWSIHRATNHPVVVAFSTANLMPVAKALREKYGKDQSIVICADNDRWSLTHRGPNPGVIYAQEAAKEIDAFLAIPDFEDLSGKPTDFNDLMALEGLDAVRQWLDPTKAAAARIVSRANITEHGASRTHEDSLPDGDWPQLPDLPAAPEPDHLPVDAFPEWLRSHVSSVAGALQVPSDLPASLALASLSAALAGHVEVEVRPGWREPVGIYTGAILPPASRKSPAFSHMIAPVRQWEASRVAQAISRVAQAMDEVDVLSKRLEKLKEKKAKEVESENELSESPLDREQKETELAKARKKLEKARASIPPDGRLLVGDVTPEALVIRMAAQGGRAALLEPEPGPLQLVAGRYSETARLDELKKAWSGESLLVDRVGRPPVSVPHPALTLGLCLQPGVLESLQNAKAFRTEGVLGRFLWCRPPHGLGTRLTGPEVPPLDASAEREYSRLLRVLLDTKPAGTDDDGAPVPHVLSLGSEALDVLHRYEAEVETGLADGARFEDVRDWLGKAVGQAVRVGALLELAARAADDRPLFKEPIGRWAMQGGVRLLRAFSSHALAVLIPARADSGISLQAYVLRRARSLPDGSTLRDLFEACRGKNEIDRMEDLVPLVEDLERRGCLRLKRPASRGTTGRPSSPTFELHPKIAESIRRIRRTPSGPLITGLSADIADPEGTGTVRTQAGEALASGILAASEDEPRDAHDGGEMVGLLDGLIAEEVRR